jgi:hypothetical protein
MLKLLIALAVVMTAAFPFAPGSVAGEVTSVSNAPELKYPPQVSNERGIKVTATPQEIGDEAKTWDFRVVLETHTRDLSDDVAKAAVLVADGRQYPPVGWEGAAPGGHHRKGLLRFKAIAPRPASVELQIRLSGDQSPRGFRWSLK